MCWKKKNSEKAKKKKKPTISARERIVESEANLAPDSPLAKIKVREALSLSSPPIFLLKRCLSLTRCSFHGTVYRSDCGANLILGLREGE